MPITAFCPLCFLYKKVFSVSKVILHHVLHLLEGVSAMCIINYLKYQFLILINERRKSLLFPGRNIFPPSLPKLYCFCKVLLDRWLSG